MRIYGFPAAPMVLAVVLGPMLEQTMRQALMISRGSPAIFVTRPISLAVLVAAAVLLAVPALRGRRRRPAPVAAQG